MNHKKILAEIRGFDGPEDYAKFLRDLESACSQKDLIEIPMDLDYGKGEIYGGRWFMHAPSRTIWRLEEPSQSFQGLWEKVDFELLGLDFAKLFLDFLPKEEHVQAL